MQIGALNEAGAAEVMLERAEPLRCLTRSLGRRSRHAFFRGFHP